MKPWQVWLAVLVVLTVGGALGVRCAQRGAVEYNAQVRVEYLLRAMRTGAGSEAIELWYTGNRGINQETKNMSLERYSEIVDQWSRWLAQKELKGTISSFSVDRARFVAERSAAQTSVARVYCTIDGRSLAMTVAQGEPISWSD